MIISCLSIQYNHQNEYIKLAKSTVTTVTLEEHPSRYLVGVFHPRKIANAEVPIASGSGIHKFGVKFANERAALRECANLFTNKLSEGVINIRPSTWRGDSVTRLFPHPGQSNETGKNTHRTARGILQAIQAS
jgi:hypothetical protein